MYDFKIGAMVESFRLDTLAAIQCAAELGVNGLQMYCTKGENSPENMTAERKNAILGMLRQNGLKFSAICGDLGEGFYKPEKNAVNIEKSKRIVDLALELGTNIITTHIGVIPADKEHERYKIMQEACHSLAEYADSVGAHFAVETGPEPSAVLRDFLDSLGSKGVSVNLDPANLVMVTGDDQVKAVYNLRNYIVHTHAKDGVMLCPCNPEKIYGVKPKDESERGVSFYREVPLGTGSVNFPEYLAALDDIGYHGFLTIEREVGNDPIADIKTAYNFLNKLIR